jgi:hypothetical protein
MLASLPNALCIGRRFSVLSSCRIPLARAGCGAMLGCFRESANSLKEDVRMKAHLATITLCLLATSACVHERTPRVEGGSGKSTAARVIISTDFPPLDVIPVKRARKGDPPEKCSDPDDVQSMVRFLLYVNEFNVEGLIASAGTFANVAKRQNILDILNLYDQVDENLRRHDPRYPTAEKLRSVT